MPKKLEPLEITDTNEIPVVSVDIDTSYEALLPDPVRASDHVSSAWQYHVPMPKSKYENILLLASTIAGAIALGATVLGVGVMIGAGI